MTIEFGYGMPVVSETSEVPVVWYNKTAVWVDLALVASEAVPVANEGSDTTRAGWFVLCSHTHVAITANTWRIWAKYGGVPGWTRYVNPYTAGTLVSISGGANTVSLWFQVLGAVRMYAQCSTLTGTSLVKSTKVC